MLVSHGVSHLGPRLAFKAGRGFFGTDLLRPLPACGKALGAFADSSGGIEDVRAVSWSSVERQRRVGFEGQEANGIFGVRLKYVVEEREH